MTQESRSSMTPLWVISLFVSLAEVVTGIAATQTSGSTQLVLTIFAVTFPIFIATAFFLVLWHRPTVFYPPREFVHGVTVGEYAKATTYQNHDEGELLEIIKNTIESSLASEDVQSLLESISTSDPDKSDPTNLSQIVDAASRKAEESFEKQVLTIDLGPITKNNKGTVYRPYYHSQFVTELLNGIYRDISQYVDPHTYDKNWILIDSNSGREYRNIGTRYAEDRGESQDFRTLNDIGFYAGQSLSAVPH